MYSRRTLIAAGAAAPAAVSIIGPLVGLSSGSVGLRDELTGVLSRLSIRWTALAPIGLYAVGSGAERTDLAQLSASIFGDHRRPSEALHRTLASAIRADFKNDRTTYVQGWVLADTEVRLSVLAAALRLAP